MKNIDAVDKQRHNCATMDNNQGGSYEGHVYNIGDFDFAI